MGCEPVSADEFPGTDAAVLAEQLKRMVAALRFELNTLQQLQAHERELVDLRLKNLEARAVDQEARLRNATDGVAQFKMFAGLAGGGSTILSVIALLKAFFGV